ncbi:probable transcription repressor OFP9 [Pyrus x bretschneideri]|uniref:probable transcription repressor OFP9 n=1 Tax=Pyrus x bretschneideri TaxID=225117 RepID=UPI00202E5DB8|nr:probable transcription repressor OFP9 [Pyrus x bretschneideri]
MSSSCLEEVASSSSDRYPSISSLSHAMVQERHDQMIRERQEGSRHVDHRRREQRAGDDHDQIQAGGGTKFVVMVAMEKCSYDPKEDFRESMAVMIVANRIEEPKDLHSLLNYYVSMNSDEHRGLILEVIH